VFAPIAGLELLQMAPRLGGGKLVVEGPAVGGGLFLSLGLGGSRLSPQAL